MTILNDTCNSAIIPFILIRLVIFVADIDSFSRLLSSSTLANLQKTVCWRWLLTRAHSFPRQILPNSAMPFAKFCSSQWQILGIPRLTAAAHFRVHCADFGPVMPQNFSIIVTSNKNFNLNFEAVVMLQGRWMAYTELLCRYTTTVLTHLMNELWMIINKFQRWSCV